MYYGLRYACSRGAARAAAGVVEVKLFPFFWYDMICVCHFTKVIQACTLNTSTVLKVNRKV